MEIAIPMASAASDAREGRIASGVQTLPLLIEPPAEAFMRADADECGVPPLDGLLSIDLNAQAPPRRADRRALLAGLLAASIAHGAILYAMVQRTQDAFGAGGQELEAINVEIVVASALESHATASGGAAAADVAETPGADSAAAEAAPRTERREEAKPEAEKQVTALPPDAVAEPSPDAVAPASRERPREKPEEEPKREEKVEAQAAREEPSPPQAFQAASAAAAQGGASARGTDKASAQAAAAAAASPGVARDYAKAVVTALSKSKPKAPGGGLLGTVRVSFVIGWEGELSDLKVAKSSGRDALDNAALDAVRRAKFPAPPTGLTTAQLTYEVPYHFR